ncbi:unnamed protein product, partial [Mesorhabditis belari]|uniref:GPI transamidase component PIG-T n=1 Tax=Mesorhabditis belari TaxID=2138241 RepID=A0AAF3J596_9BILA
MFWKILLLTLFGGILASNEESYVEELLISRLPSDHHLAQFRFIITSRSLELGPNYELFPRVLGQLLQAHGIQELEYIATQGVWHSDHYGPPPQPASSTGAFLSAKFDGPSNTVDDRWLSVVNSLNGAFCASLLSMVPAETYKQKNERKGDYPKAKKLFSRAGTLPREALCTENLTPWRKLLPCKQNGLISLLNPHKLYGSLFHSMGFHIHPECKDNSCWYRLELSAIVLFDVPISENRRLDWSLKSFFDRPISGVCNAATRSTVLVHQHEEQADSDKPADVITINGQQFAVYPTEQILGEKTEGNIFVRYTKSVDLHKKNPPRALSISSTLGGKDTFSGLLLTTIKNNENEKHTVVYEQVLPWWVRFHYHTKQVLCHDSKQEIVKPYVANRVFSGAIDRKRPAYIQMEIELPANSKCIVSYNFERAFLRMAEYPPDANHGLYIPAATITLMKRISTGLPEDSRCTERLGNSSECEPRAKQMVFSNVLLVPMPVPDFSMPFNVICLVGTAVSLCFGAVHPFSTRILVPINEKLPGQSIWRTIFRGILLVLMAGACYMEYNNISLNALRREIEKLLSFQF